MSCSCRFVAETCETGSGADLRKFMEKRLAQRSAGLTQLLVAERNACHHLQRLSGPKVLVVKIILFWIAHTEEFACSP